MCAFVRLRCGIARARDGATIRFGLASRSATSPQRHHRLEPWPARAAGPCGACRARNRSDAAQLWWPPPAAAAASNLRKTSARTVHQPQGISKRSACRGGCQVACSMRGSRLDEVVGSIARSLLDARDAWAACPAHVCKQEDGQTMDMRSHEHSGSHSKPRSEGASASGRRDQTSGTRRQGHWVRGLEASSAPLDAVEG